LDGITVVTLEHAVAAPCSTRQLADLGARPQGRAAAAVQLGGRMVVAPVVLRA
jgi:autotransporter translocation and assembly factor TamB